MTFAGSAPADAYGRAAVNGAYVKTTSSPIRTCPMRPLLPPYAAPDHCVPAFTFSFAFGQKSVVRFTSFERNPKLPASSFTFTPPQGADVVGDK